MAVEVDDTASNDLQKSESFSRTSATKLTFSATASIQPTSEKFLLRLLLVKYETRDDGRPAADLILSISCIPNKKTT